ncbi:MAG: transcriptional regulator [Lysobacteraceae bacterium]|nr:MAG: transcriptional regulator [Xanthomonadaceae bacterium]
MTPDPLEDVWKALAHPVRRSILDAIRDEPKATGELTALFPEVSRFSVMQHIKVLEKGQLLSRRKQGRHCIHYINPVPIQQIYHRWVRHYESNWAESLVSLKNQLENPSELPSNTEQRNKK